MATDQTNDKAKPQAAAQSAPKGKRTRFRRGVMPLIAIAGALSVGVGWALSVNDPYWRLNGSEPIPALTQNGVTVQGALAANTDPLANVRRPSPALAVVNRLAATITEPVVTLAPMPDLTPIPTPQALVGPAIASAAGYMAPRIALNPSTSVVVGDDVAIARAPLALPMPAADDRITGDTVAAFTGMTAPRMRLVAPTRPHFAASEESELAMALSRQDRIEVQRRLALAGFDPKGFDGVFGERTRASIEDFQVAHGYPQTGYLEPAMHAALSSTTEEAYAEMRRRAHARDAAKAASENAVSEVTSIEQGQCARDSEGRIIPRQSLKCDLAGLSEGFSKTSGTPTAKAPAGNAAILGVNDR